MFGGKTSDQWISEYARSHEHRVNRFCHTIGIPLIVVSLLLFLVSLPFARFRIIAAIMAITIGQRVGAYQVISLLGRGGMGEVYRPRHPVST